MEKLIFTIIIYLVTVNCYSQDKLLNILPLKDGKVNYSGVVTIDSVNKDELYNRSNLWFVDTYKSSKDVIQLDDKANGNLVGKGYFDVYWMYSFVMGLDVSIWHTVKLQFKDGKYKYEIYDFNVKYYVSSDQYTSGHYVDEPLETWNNSRKKNMLKLYPKIDEQVKSMISSLEKYVRTKPIIEKW